MAHFLKNASAALGIFALLTSPAVAHANTRASDGGTYYTVASTAQVGAFPYSMWLVPKERNKQVAWKWLTEQATGVLLLAALISYSSGQRATHRSNGAN